MKVILAHPGTQYAFQLASQLFRRSHLAAFHTGFAFIEGEIFDQLLTVLPKSLSRRLANRRLKGVPRNKVFLHLRNELLSQLPINRGASSEEVLHQRNEIFQKSISTAQLRDANAVIGFDTSAWLLAEKCTQLGIPFILDQSIAHPDSKVEIFANLLTQFPRWEAGIEPRTLEVRLAEQREHEQSSLIMVASSFTKETLIANGVDSRKIRINPYGVDAEKFTVAERHSSRPHRFIFVGSITARKGVPLLLRAWERLQSKDAELWLVGPVAPGLRSQICTSPRIKVFGAVPHSEIPALLVQCDAFVFPSYFEGFGLVILEALACGLPVITTTATAGPDLFENGEAGWIIRSGGLDELVSAMADCLTRPEQLRQMGKAARAIAEANSWSAYGDRWSTILASL
jgi:starch synthase